MAVLNFPSPYPYGPPRSGMESALTGLSDLLKAMQEARKRKYEAELWKDVLANIDKPAKKGESKSLLAELGKTEPTTAVPDLLSATGPAITLRSPMAGMAQQGISPQAPITMEGISKLLSTMPEAPQFAIPEAMRTRLAGQPQESFLRRVGQAFNPMAPYRGPLTELEQSFIGKGMEQSMVDPLTRITKQLEFVKTLSDILKTGKPKEVKKETRVISPGQTVKAFDPATGEEIYSYTAPEKKTTPTTKSFSPGQVVVYYDVEGKEIKREKIPEKQGKPTAYGRTQKTSLANFKRMIAMKKYPSEKEGWQPMENQQTAFQIALSLGLNTDDPEVKELILSLPVGTETEMWWGPEWLGKGKRTKALPSPYGVSSPGTIKGEGWTLTPAK